MSGGGGAFIGINGSPLQQQQQGGGGDGAGVGAGEEGMTGSVYSTGSGGYSYMMQPLGGDGPDAAPTNRVRRHIWQQAPFFSCFFGAISPGIFNTAAVCAQVPVLWKAWRPRS